MKKILCIAATALAVVSSVISCTKDGFQIDDPYINESGCIYMHVGEYYIVNCTADPETAKWSSSDTDVVTADNGVIIALKSGSAKVTVNPKMGKRITFVVYVTAVPITDFTIAESFSIYAGNYTYVEIKGLTPENASASSIVWESSDNSIFTVNAEEGGVRLTGIAEGTATLTGKADDVTRTSTVTVKGPEKITLPSKVDAYVNHDVEVSIVQEPEVYTDYSWSIRQEGHICDLRSEGAKAVLTGYAVGKCTLELTLAGGSIKKSCEVTVNTGSLVLDKSESTLIAGDNLTLTATQYPVQYSDYEWVSDDTGVATVSGSGNTAVVKAGNKTGETVIRCYVNGRDICASCRISTYGEDYLDALMFVLVRPNRDPVNLGDNVYVAPDHSSDTELRVITMYKTDLPECFKGRIKWNTGTPSEDSFSTVIKNQNKYREFTVTCSTPVGNYSINYVQGFKELEVRKFVYSDFRPGTSIHYNWYQEYGTWYFKPFYKQLPDKTFTLWPEASETMSIGPNQEFFFTGVDSYEDRSYNCVQLYGTSNYTEGLTAVRDRISLVYESNTITSSSYGSWLKTDDVTTTKSFNGSVSVNGQLFKIRGYIKP